VAKARPLRRAFLRPAPAPAQVNDIGTLQYRREKSGLGLTGKHRAEAARRFLVEHRMPVVRLGPGWRSRIRVRVSVLEGKIRGLEQESLDMYDRRDS